MDRGPTLEVLRAEIARTLALYLDAHARRVPEAEDLIAEIGRVVRAGGKRLRPAFCYWGYRAGGGEHHDGIIAAAASLELLHTFAIVHDDIMDSSAERRGEPTTVAKLGLDTALLVGDLALVLADACLRSSGFPADVLLPALEEYTAMQVRVIAGQHLDVTADAEFQTVERARHIAVLKSGSYSVEGPLAIGLRLAAAGDDTVIGFAKYSAPLGEAFQLRDDILGVFGEPALVGKPIDADIREGKRNVLYALTVESLAGAERERFVRGWGDMRLSQDAIEELRGLIERSGAPAATEASIAELHDRAITALDDLDIPPDARAALVELAAVSVQRGS